MITPKDIQTNKNFILTIAGLDPSSGAGITSDIKTFEAHKLYGLSVCTAITVQNDICFDDCIWVDDNAILMQIELVFKRFLISTVKIGIIQSWETALKVVKTLKRLNPNIKIVLDPVLNSSTGFSFHNDSNFDLFLQVLEYCHFITPNYQEIQGIFPEKSIAETVSVIANKTNIYLKGGHRTDKKGTDEIYHSGIVQFNLSPGIDHIHEKHGSGCVLSAALASNLANNMTLEDACRYAKHYIEVFLNSNESFLGTHNYSG